MERGSLKRIVGGFAVLAVTAGLGTAVTAGPATSATSTDCPDPYTGALDPGLAVHGLTVSSGTTPEPFTGTVLGVLAAGIAPDIDMIMVRLTSPEIDRVGGIWQGMSGSPVYADDGTLIGAVSYGLSWGSSPVAGVTPAADMLALAGQDTATAPTRAHVKLPARMVRKLVDSGTATQAEATSGMSPLRLPLVVTGLSRARDRDELVSRLGLGDSAGTVVSGSSSAASDDFGKVVPGGNLAAAWSTGTVSSGALGTATVVCGTKVVGFGHPMEYAGKVRYGMLNADTLFVQEDPTGPAFKVANIGQLVGKITGDHMAGIVGVQRSTPPAPWWATISSAASFGQREKSGSTDVYVRRNLADFAAFTMYAIQDRAFDHYGPGSSTATWTIKGTRADGSSYALERSDVFSSKYGITFSAPDELYGELRAIRRAGGGTVDTVTTDSALTAKPGQYAVGTVERRLDGAWRLIHRGTTLRLQAGTTLRLRVQLTSDAFATRTVLLSVAVPARAAGASGELDVVGGSSYYLSTSGMDLDQVLEALRTKPHNGDVVAQLQLGRNGWSRQVRDEVSAGHVVQGARYISVAVTR